MGAIAFNCRFYIYALLCIIMLVAACQPTRITAQPEELVIKTATDKLGADIESYPNSTGEYILFVQKENLSATKTLRFVVIQNASRKIILEQSFVPGYAKWVSNSTLEVLSVPGAIKENESLTDYVKVIHVRSN